MISEEALTAAVRPRDVVAAAGAWLAGSLAAEGFAWHARPGHLQRSLTGLEHRIALAPSWGNTRGSVTVWTYVGVHDPAMRAARGPDAGLVCGLPLGYASGRAHGYCYGDWHDGELQLGDPSHRGPALTDLLGKIREGVLPYFAEASDPDTLVGSFAGDRTANPEALVEWLAFRGRPDLVTAYGERFLARHPGWAPRWAAGAAEARAGRPRPFVNDTVQTLAWTVITLTRTAEPA